jgi:hypothetical protein
MRNRNLMTAMKKLHLDYLFQIKSNRGEAFEAVKDSCEKASVSKAGDTKMSRERERRNPLSWEGLLF